MSMCRVFSCVVGKGCLLWPVCSLGKTLLAFALLHFVLQGQICLLLQAAIDFLLLHSSPLWTRGHLFGMLVLEGFVDLHRTIQLQLLQHYWLEHRLGLLWYWMVCLGNEWRLFCHFEISSYYCIQFSLSGMSNSLWPHVLQHARPPCSSSTPRVFSHSSPLSQWCHPTISSSIVLFSSCLQSFQHHGLFK